MRQPTWYYNRFASYVVPLYLESIHDWMTFFYPQENNKGAVRGLPDIGLTIVALVLGLNDTNASNVQHNYYHEVYET